MEVLHWPWVVVEEIWKSFMKRQRRDLKCKQALSVTGVMGGMAGALTGAGRSRTVSGRPATDEDNWDMEPEQVAGLAAQGFPVKIVQTPTMQ